MDTGQQQKEEVVNELDDFFHLSFDAAACEQLRQCALWAKIGAIVNFILCLLFLCFWIFTNSGIYVENPLFKALLNFMGIGGGMTASFFLYRFGTRIRKGLRNADALPVNQGFGSLRQYFKTNGIVIIVGISLFLMAIVITVLNSTNIQ